MTHRFAVGLITICFAVLTLGLLVGAAGGAAPLAIDGDERPSTAPEDFDATTFEITVFENDSARWTVQHSTPLENDSDVEQFEAFAEEFTSTETETYRDFVERANRLVEGGTDATGREMDATGFTRDAYVESLGQTRGFVELSFVWTNFAAADGDATVVADVFRGGMFVDESQRLVVRTGPEVVFDEASPPPDSMAEDGDLEASDSITWFGERQFADQRPRLAVVPEDATAGSDAGTGDDTGTGGDAGNGDDGASQEGDGNPASDPSPGVDSDLLAVLVLLFVLVIGLAGGAAWYRGVLPGRGTNPPGPSSDGGAGAATVDGPGSESSGTGVPASELLSDEDRVLTLLEENGGRMKQVNIVEETEWSKSKVSMLLSDMEDEGQISKLRVGRENIVSIAGQEPEAAGSPFEDE